ncbi:protein-tyrosine phosphatase [Gillisia mitskevichiae]|uniref:protein-tyrosine-phosphatase n=1 Tax=Gillisia mitskevichiae TaxID=270921 RepID=A0A495PKQ5_9FLAO|nr:CpsB/CapC family capsule biosynthesis tyrosine phosphatase [Gillisia mitskevichiae]RKS50566.1 protein-tyrosine phosphatase [Gillisia mitskevichiae]
MISIFRKKEYLIDHLQGITDIHNHILPGIDDGAQNVEDSVKLLEKFKDLGISKFIATPHIMNDYYPNTPQSINTALNLLKVEIKKNENLKNTEIRFAAEYMMDQNFLDLMKSEQLLALKDNMVLVEMSYFQAPINLNEILFKLQTKGYKPVLAHPERYAFYHAKDLNKYQELKNRGCLFQLNILSLTSHYGGNMQKIASKLLENGMIDFIGSDAHRIQHIEKQSTIKLERKPLKYLKEVISRTKDQF